MTPRTKITPPRLAARWGIDACKVVSWIKSGQLKAINAAASLHGRPRYLIDETDVAEFEQRRTVTVEPKPTRRKRQSASIIEFF